MFADSVPTFVAPTFLAIGLASIFVAFVLLVVHAIRKTRNTRSTPVSVAKAHDTKLLIDVRECAGWIMGCLTDPLFNNLELLGMFKRTQELTYLQARLSHHPKIAEAMMRFRLAARKLESAKENRTELNERLVSAHRDLMEEIGRII